MKKIKIEFRVLLHENFDKDIVYLGIRWWFFKWCHAIRIPIPFMVPLIVLIESMKKHEET
jgi:hypothetical protein